MSDQNKDNLLAAGSAGVEVVAWRVSHPDTVWKVYERNPESWAAGDYEIQELMTVAQHEHIVAAMQQDLDYFPATVRSLTETIAELRALLASHGRG